MEPRVQYAQTADGVSIAYSVAGSGKTLVLVPSVPFTHVQRAWELPGYYLQGLAESFRLVWYDSRGSGLSDRNATDFSMDAMMRDLETVLAGAVTEPFVLMATYDGTPIAATYAATRPERVSHLILVDGWSKFSDYIEGPTLAAEMAMRAQDWALYTETLARVFLGFDDPELAQQFGAFMRECVQPEALRKAAQASEGVDTTGLLSQITAKTLVLHNRNNRFLPIDSGRRLGTRIPGAQFMLIDDMSYHDLPRLAAEFLMEDQDTPAERTAVSGFRTVLFTDMARSTSMMQRLGDVRGREVLREHERITREVLKQHGGTEVKTMGDGFMASFSSVTKAVECAIALQRAFDERNRRVGAGLAPPEGAASSAPTTAEPLVIRIGLNAGEPIEEEGPDGRSDLFGTTVILAARIAAQAEGREILASLAVRELCAGKGFLLADRGETALRGFEDPVRLFEVRWRE